jgi:hypothetical protein
VVEERITVRANGIYREIISLKIRGADYLLLYVNGVLT